jgi:hypothetical protein
MITEPAFGRVASTGICKATPLPPAHPQTLLPRQSRSGR